jgi:hypothetical protein
MTSRSTPAGSQPWLTSFELDSTVGCISGVVLPAELETQAQVQFEQFGGHSKGRGFRRVVFDQEYIQSYGVGLGAYYTALVSVTLVAWPHSRAWLRRPSATSGIPAAHGTPRLRISQTMWRAGTCGRC